MLLGTLGASLLESILAGSGATATSQGQRSIGKRQVRGTNIVGD